jgi:hypothetical protein
MLILADWLKDVVMHLGSRQGATDYGAKHRTQVARFELARQPLAASLRSRLRLLAADLVLPLTSLQQISVGQIVRLDRLDETLAILAHAEREILPSQIEVRRLVVDAGQQ